MTDQSHLIFQIFQAIEQDDDGHYFWTLLEEINQLSQGTVYMTYAGETPQSLAKKLDRHHLLRLLQMHEKLISIRNQFD